MNRHFSDDGDIGRGRGVERESVAARAERGSRSARHSPSKRAAGFSKTMEFENGSRQRAGHWRTLESAPQNSFSIATSQKVPGTTSFERSGNREFCPAADVRNGSRVKNASGRLRRYESHARPDGAAPPMPRASQGRGGDAVVSGETRRSEMVGDARDRHVRPTLVGRRRGLRECGVDGNG
jgi:hypothetical protein